MAITSASYQENKQLGPDQYSVRVRIVTNDARGTFDRWFTVSGDTLQELRDSLSKQLAALTAVDSRGNILAGIAPGTAVPITYTPPAAAALTEKQVWRNKVALRQELTGPAYSGAAATALAALDADINTTYQAGFMNA